MYTVIIVDDEFIIRQFYSNIIDWNDLGFYVSNLFRSAEEALTYMQNNKVDCVITDIKMTSMNGIELLKICKEKHPDTKVVLISGYSDFEYAKDAVKYGATDYLLKPLDSQELYSCMEKIKSELDKKQVDIFMLQQYKREFLNAVLHGHYRNENNITNLLESHKIDIPKNSQIAVIEINTEKNFLEKTISEYTLESFSAIMQNLVEKSRSLTNGYFISAVNGTIYYLLYSHKATEDFDKFSDEHIKAFVSILNDLNITCISHKKSVYSSFYELCSENRRIKLKNTDNSDIERILDSNKFLSEQKKLLLTYIYSGNTDETKKQLSEFFEELKENDIETIKKLSLNIVETIIEEPFFNNTNIDKTKIKKYLSELKEASDISKVFSTTLATIEYIISYIGTDRKNNFSHNSVILAKKYIEEHFNEDISLEKLSSMYYLSSSHFSRTFSSVFGISYIEFLKKCRMEKAKALLRDTDYKIYHIGEMVGYENTKLFARTFKSTYGISPKEYRERKQGVVENENF